MTKTFQALVLTRDGDNISAEISERSMNILPDGSVTIAIDWSSVNYKDGLAILPNGRVVRDYPRVPGIDLAGMVTRSSDPRFTEG